MAEPSAFSDPNFDPIAYVNMVCHQCPSNTPLERHLAEVEMRLHIQTEQVAQALAEQSVRAAQVLPASTRQLGELQSRVQAAAQLSEEVLASLQLRDRGEEDVVGDGMSGGASLSEKPLPSTIIAEVAELERASRAAQGAARLLREASGVSALFSRAEDCFAARDLKAAADTLRSLRHGVGLVGSVLPELRDAPARLQALQGRLRAALEQPLARALEAAAGQRVEELVGLLEAAEGAQEDERSVDSSMSYPAPPPSFSTTTTMLAALYMEARAPQLSALWESALPRPGSALAQAPYAASLPVALDAVARALDKEAAWTRAHCPGRERRLLAGLAARAAEATLSSRRQKTARALEQAGGPGAALEALGQVCAAEADFLGFLNDLLAGEEGAEPCLEPAQLRALRNAVEAPGQEALQRYVSLERAAFGSALAELRAWTTAGAPAGAPAGATAGAPAAGPSPPPLAPLPPVPQLLADLAPLCEQGETALARCAQLTGGAALAELAQALDAEAAAHVAALGAAVARRGRGGTAPERALALAALGAALEDRVGELARAAREALCSLGAAALREAEGEEGGSSAELRILTAPPAPRRLAQDAGLRAGLGAAVGQALREKEDDGARTTERPASEQRPASCLPRASGAARALRASLEGQALAALLARVEAACAQAAGAPEYCAGEPPAVPGTAPLPQFSAYPLAPVTAAGEYLLQLPHALEAALAEAGADAPASDTGAEALDLWIERVARGAGETFVAALRRMKTLSPRGAAQLAADLEYFCNVLATLGARAPDSLGAWAAAAAAAAEDLPKVLEDAGRADNPAEAREAVSCVMRLRRAWADQGRRG